MTELELLYKEIRVRSRFIVSRGYQWRKAISSAKNYIATADLKHWTFGKSAGLNGIYHYNGGAAKRWLYGKGFIDVLKLPDSKLKNKVTKAFLTWCRSIKAFDIAAKFYRDQQNKRRFELLIHRSLLPFNKIEPSRSKKNQKEFHEGLNKQILIEIKKRNAGLVQHAKEVYGTTCETCSFDFGHAYGAHGEGFIEMHHLYPLSNGSRRSTLADLRPVCSNCHRMLHRGSKVLSIEELKRIIKQARAKNRK